MKRVLLALAALVFTATVCMAQAKDFTADMTQSAGAMQITGKTARKGNKQRTEINSPMGKQIIIVRGDLKKVWMISPDQKSYVEQPIPEGQNVAPENWRKMMPKEAKVKKVGSEKINGHQCDKFTVAGGQATQTLWVSNVLGFPIRMITNVKGPDGKPAEVRMEYTNIKLGAPADSLFNLPAGYKKTDMPAGMMGGGPGGPRRAPPAPR